MLLVQVQYVSWSILLRTFSVPDDKPCGAPSRELDFQRSARHEVALVV